MYNLRNRSFLKEIDFTTGELQHLLTLSAALKTVKYACTEVPRLKGEIALIFEKTSTRTRSAFEVAAYDQGAHVTYLDPSGSHGRRARGDRRGVRVAQQHRLRSGRESAAHHQGRARRDARVGLSAARERDVDAAPASAAGRSLGRGGETPARAGGPERDRRGQGSVPRPAVPRGSMTSSTSATSPCGIGSSCSPGRRFSLVAANYGRRSVLAADVLAPLCDYRCDVMLGGPDFTTRSASTPRRGLRTRAGLLDADVVPR